MKTETLTYYAVRVVCIRKDGEPMPPEWVCKSFHGVDYRLYEDRDKNNRQKFKRPSDAKRALKYACVRDILRQVWVSDSKNRPNSVIRVTAKKACRYEAQIVKITETRIFEEEILLTKPERAALEQLARAAK